MRDSIRGGERVALDAVRASGAPHAFLSVSKQGVAGIVETTGNKDCHVVLPAESLHSLNEECSALTTLELPSRVMVKCAASPGKQRAPAAAASFTPPPEAAEPPAAPTGTQEAPSKGAGLPALSNELLFELD